MFDIINYLKDFNIAFKTNGKNSSKDFINVCCYNCNDSTFHLGIHKSKDYGSCWRCGYKSLYDIISHLTPFENPKEIIQLYNTEIFIKEKITEKLKKKVTKIILPGENLKQVHKDYLKKRGFDPDYLEKKYKLKGTLNTAEYPYRIIIPIYQNDILVSYQTRSIRNEIRYLNCNPENEIISIKDCLYNIDNCNSNYIVVMEGVFKVFRFGDNSCACLGKNFTNKQIKLLTKYEKIFIWFDDDIPGQSGAEKLSNILDSLGKQVFNIVNGKPDELSNFEMEKVKKDINSILNL
jgi:hypothetical protein